ISESVFKYKDGILALVTKKDINKFDINELVYELISKLNINSDDYYIGIGNYHSSLYELDYGITECLNASKVGEKNQKNLSLYNDIGIYKILLPYLDDHWVQDFYLNLITPIKNYDEKNSTDMLITAIAYIENEGIIKNTAQFLFQHENTIRYRINKIKEILKMENSDGYFYEQLSIAIKIYKLINI
ncbi:MAG: transcriptional regulator, PucR family, partial [Bacillota bacterium]|nr:transcriptional regulator, PucR family [Bacillota bacterium]